METTAATEAAVVTEEAEEALRLLVTVVDKMARSNTRWLCFALLVPAVAGAQFDFGGGSGGGSSSKPWTEFKLNTKTRVKLDYRNSSVDAILNLYQKLSGITIIKDPALTGTLTLTSARPVPLNDAFAILSTTLGLKGFEMRKEDNLLIIQAKQQQGRGGFPGGGTFDPSIFTQGQQSDTVLKVYQIQYANASQLARVLNEVFTSTGTTGAAGFGNNRFGGGQGGFGQPGGAGRFGGATGATGFGGFQRGGNSSPTVKASADDFSNSIIVNAADREQEQVARLVKQLDKPTDTPITSKVFKLKFAAASDAVTTVQNVLNANVPRGKGGATTSQSSGPGAFISAIRGSTSGAGTAVADTRTNSIVVSATQENIDTVTKVIGELDLDVPIQSTTFVFTLSNAKADTVASLLKQAFGTRTGLNSSTSNTNTTGRVNNSSSSSSSSSRRSTNSNSLGEAESKDGATVQTNSEFPVALKDPTANSGELMTSVAVSQGFGGQFFGGQSGNRSSSSSSSSSQSTLGRGTNGQIVNVRDLTNQVTAIADTATNSIIVVTTPENEPILKSILEKLDKIPEQVMIETLIVEASLDSSDKMGVEWNLTSSLSRTLGDTTGTGTGGSNFGLASDTSAGANQGMKYTVTGKNLTAFITALKTDEKYQVLSAPRIFTSNNVEAEINISQSVPYVTNTRIDSNGNYAYNYSYQDVGVVLTVTPRITSAGFVTMDVSQTANDLVSYTSFNAPIINQRQADTTVSVKDGETIILGGIIRKTVDSKVSKVPVLGDLPFLGNLFKSRSKTSNRTELLVFLTPHIVHNPDDAARLRQQNEKLMSPETRKSMLDFRINGNNVNPPAKSNGGN